jgi:hypothetical protein
MKKMILVSLAYACVLIMYFNGSVLAQDVVTLDWGGSTLIDYRLSPYYFSYSQSRHQFILTKSDFTISGYNSVGPVGFKSISFYIAAMRPSSGSSYFSIRMKNTNKTDFFDGHRYTFDNSSGKTQVFGPTSIASTMIASIGWYTHSFQTPFIWDGISNIIVDICHDNGDFNWTSTWPVRYGFPVRVNTYCAMTYWDDYMTGFMCNTGDYYVKSRALPNMKFELCKIRDASTAFTCDAKASVPGTIDIMWSIFHPTISSNVSIYFQLYTPSGTAVGSLQGIPNIPILAGNASSGTFKYDATGIAYGSYRIEATYSYVNSCGLIDEYKHSRSILLYAPTMNLCAVWPGDVNNDGLVNYGDRKSLNMYIYNANLRESWLEGPIRYHCDSTASPIANMAWDAQPAIAWNTPEGCYMDTDGNGVVNGLDYVAIKLNWMKTHGSPRAEEDVSPLTFGMSQNYPNPFNPSTTIKYSAPEPSDVRLTVMDRMGRTVATLINKRIETGLHEVEFDAAGLASGHYWAHIDMVGVESGLTYRKTIKMTLLR